MNRILAGLLAVVTLVATSGCVQTNRPPPSEETRAQFRRVGVRIQSGPESINQAKPVTGWAAGAGAGLLRGVVNIPTYFLKGAILYSLDAIIIGSLLMVAWLPFSILGGALTAEDAAATRAALTDLHQAVVSMRPAEAVQSEFVRLAEDEARVPICVVHDPDGRRGVDTLIELTLTVGLDGESWMRTAWTVNPERSLKATLHARTLRTRDGTVLDERDVAWNFGQLSFVEWGKKGAAVFRANLSRALPELARRCMEEIFMLYKPVPIPAMALR